MTQNSTLRLLKCYIGGENFDTKLQIYDFTRISESITFTSTFYI